MAIQKRSLRSAPIWMVGWLGAAAAAAAGLGFYVQINATTFTVQMVAGMLAAIGGAAIGAAISLYFTAIEARDSLLEIRKLVADSLGARLRSEENAIGWIRQEWNYYYLTQQEGKYVWRHIVYRFQDGTAPGRIVIRTHDEAGGEDYEVRTEVSLQDDRMIMLETPANGTQPAIIAITPSFTDAYRSVRAGVVLLRSWDSTDLLSKCLWSIPPLVPSVDGVVAHQDAAMLETLWNKHFSASYKTLGDTIQMS